MCFNSSSGATSTSTSEASNTTNVNVSVPFSIDTTDMATAIQSIGAGDQALGAALVQSEAQNSVALAGVSAALPKLGSGGSSWTWITALAAIVGLLLTTKIIKLPRMAHA